MKLIKLKRKKKIDRYEEVGGILIGRWIKEEPGYEIIRTISIRNISDKKNRVRKYSYRRIRVFTLAVFYFFWKFYLYNKTKEHFYGVIDRKHKAGKLTASERHKEQQFFDRVFKGSILDIEVLGPWHSHPSQNCKPSEQDDREMTKMLRWKKKVLLGILVNNKMYDYLYERPKNEKGENIEKK